MTFAGLEGCFPRENLHQYIAYYDTARNVIMTEEREKMSSMKRHEKPRGFFNLTAIEHSTNNYYEELRGGAIPRKALEGGPSCFSEYYTTSSPSFASYALLFSASWHRSMSMTETCDHLSQNFPATAAEAPSAPRLLINAQLLLLQAQHNTESNKPTLDNKARM